MKHKNSHLMVGYWNRLRAGRAVPDQADIDPRAVKRFLSYTFILDCENGQPVYRLAGTALCERFGFELKGSSFLAHWEAQSALSLNALLEQALKLRRPLCLSSVAATADDRIVELETVLTPIGFHAAAPSRFFGLVQTLSDPAVLLGRAIAYERLIGSQLVDEEQPVFPHDRAPPPPPPPPAKLKPHPRAPWLRLVIGGGREHPPAQENEILRKVADAFARLAGGVLPRTGV